MTGARSRRKGHRYELDVVAYMRDHGYPEARTTRSYVGHSGTLQPGDVRIEGPVCVSIECKNVADTAWPAWLRQAERQAGTDVPVVVRKTEGSTDVGSDICILPLDDYLERLDGVPPLVRRPSRTCQADAWLRRPDHERVEWFDGTRSWAVVRFSELLRAARTSA
jgi:hypothetical protein